MNKLKKTSLSVVFLLMASSLGQAQPYAQKAYFDILPRCEGIRKETVNYINDMITQFRKYLSSHDKAQLKKMAHAGFMTMKNQYEILNDNEKAIKWTYNQYVKGKINANEYEQFIRKLLNKSLPTINELKRLNLSHCSETGDVPKLDREGGEAPCIRPYFRVSNKKLTKKNVFSAWSGQNFFYLHEDEKSTCSNKRDKAGKSNCEDSLSLYLLQFDFLLSDGDFAKDTSLVGIGQFIDLKEEDIFNYFAILRAKFKITPRPLRTLIFPLSGELVSLYMNEDLTALLKFYMPSDCYKNEKDTSVYSGSRSPRPNISLPTSSDPMLQDQEK